jgi:hypothetical protein
MSSPAKLNAFDLDLDAIDKEEVIEQLSFHITARNKPCNCKERCIVNAITFGVAEVFSHRSSETEQLTWACKLNPEETHVMSFSGDHVRKVFKSDCRGDINKFASLMITKQWRAYPREVSDSSALYQDKPKRKAKEALAGESSAKKANTSLAAKELLPRGGKTPPPQEMPSDNEEIIE